MNYRGEGGKTSAVHPPHRRPPTLNPTPPPAVSNVSRTGGEENAMARPRCVSSIPPLPSR